MKVVLNLIRLGAYVTPVQAVHGSVEGLRIHAERAEALFHPPVQPAGEGAAPAQLVLIDPRLAFVNAHGDAAPEGGEKIRRVYGLLVAGMADLMDGGIDAVERIGGVGPGGDPHVGARPRTERMHRPVDPAPRGVIAEGARDPGAQAHLGVRIEGARQRRRLARGPQRAVAQRDEPRAERAEHVYQHRRRGAGLIVVQKRVIGVAAIGQCCGLLALERDDPGQDRREGREIVRRPRLGPLALRHGGDARQFRREPRGHPRRPLETAADVAQVGLGRGIVRRGALQPVADARVGPAGVEQPLHHAHLLGPLGGGPARHHRLLVPAQAHGDVGQRLGLTLVSHQIGIGAHAGSLRDWLRG